LPIKSDKSKSVSGSAQWQNFNRATLCVSAAIAVVVSVRHTPALYRNG